MTIKSTGGVFGRNPTFNDVTVEGDFSVNGTLQSGGSNVVVDSDIGSTVQGYDADTAKLDVAQTFTAQQTFSEDVIISSNQGIELSAGEIGLGNASSYIYIGTDDTGILTNSGNDFLQPWNPSTGSSRDAGIDIGRGTSRWKNLFLSGGVYLGGTGAANLLDDYEEGSWTPVVEGTTTAGTATYVRQGGLYQKVGNVVHFVAAIVYNSHTGTGNMRVSGLPYTVFGGSDFHRIYLPFYADNLTITGVPVATAILGQTYLDLRSLNNGSSSLLAMDAAATLYITGKYWVA